MKRGVLILLMLWATALAAVETRTLVLHGPVTNTTGDDVTANVLVVLTIEGEKVTGEITTEPPLAGTGKVEGRMLGAWCEFGGEMLEGFRIAFRGAVNAKDFRGTYVATVPGEPVQYGSFQLKVQAPAKVMGAR
jgi:hypothetical protein